MSSLHNALMVLAPSVWLLMHQMIMSRIGEAVKICKNNCEGNFLLADMHTYLLSVRIDNYFVLTLEGENLETPKKK